MGHRLHGIHAAQNRAETEGEKAHCWRSRTDLCYQIEHRPFRGLPSNRYAEIATRVRALCDNFDLPTPPARCWASTCRRYGPYKLALPDRFLTAAS